MARYLLEIEGQSDKIVNNVRDLNKIKNLTPKHLRIDVYQLVPAVGRGRKGKDVKRI